MKVFFNKIILILVLFLFSVQAWAEESVFTLGMLEDGGFLGFVGLGAGLGVGLAAFGAASGQGKAASAALEGIARNPSAGNKMFVPLILSLALMESLVIFSFLVTNGLGNTVAKALGL